MLFTNKPLKVQMLVDILKTGLLLYKFNSSHESTYSCTALLKHHENIPI